MTRRAEKDTAGGTQRIIANRIAVPVAAPGRILVHPWGRTESKKGASVMDAEAAAATIAAFEGHGVDLPIDYEHHTMGGEFSSPDGKALAAGWIKKLEAVEGQGLFAEVEWTENAAAEIAAKQYRYLSPVLLVRKRDEKVMALHSVALTNKPAIVEMAPIVNKETDVMDVSEKLERVRYWLNLAETATTEEILMELEKYLTQLREAVGAKSDATGEQVVSSVKTALAELTALKAARIAVNKAAGLAETADEAALIAVVNKARETATAPTPTTATVDPARFVPVDQFKAQADRLSALETELRVNKMNAFIEGGLAAGKIVEANRAMWEESYVANSEKAAAHLAAAPVIAPPDGRQVTGTRPAAGGGTRTEVIRRACKEYRAEQEVLSEITSLEAFVVCALSEAKLDAKITDEDKKLIAA